MDDAHVASEDLAAVPDGDTYDPYDPADPPARLQTAGFVDAEVRVPDLAETRPVPLDPDCRRELLEVP